MTWAPEIYVPVIVRTFASPSIAACGTTITGSTQGTYRSSPRSAQHHSRCSQQCSNLGCSGVRPNKRLEYCRLGISLRTKCARYPAGTIGSVIGEGFYSFLGWLRCECTSDPRMVKRLGIHRRMRNRRPIRYRHCAYEVRFETRYVHHTHSSGARTQVMLAREPKTNYVSAGHTPVHQGNTFRPWNCLPVRLFLFVGAPCL